MKDSKLLDEVIRYYLDSSSFNGLPIYEIENYDVNEMIELINDGFGEAISEVDVLNPHIKGFDLGLSKEHQIVNARNTDRHTCFYSTDRALEEVQIDYQKPYTALLQRGKEQFKVIFLI